MGVPKISRSFLTLATAVPKILFNDRRINYPRREYGRRVLEHSRFQVTILRMLKFFAES